MLFERLTEDEKTIIDVLRRNYSDNSDSEFFSGEFVDNQTFLRFWEDAKAPMAEAFGDRLIVKKPLNIMLEDDELYNKMHRIFNMMEYTSLRSTICDFVRDHNEYEWEHRVISSDHGHTYTLSELFLYNIFCDEAWVANRYDGPTCEIKLGEGNVMKLAHGCKVMKALGRIVKACGGVAPEWFETMRLRQSQVLNEARINANLCISIHPLDYMTASYNNNDWRSCMCWEDGEYRRGVIEMMNSEMVVVAYVESKSQKLDWYRGPDEPRLEWNSKRWREFFIVRPDMISGIKGYPYWNRTLEDEAITMLRDMFAPIFGTKYSSKVYSWQVDRDVEDEHWDLRVRPEMECGPAMYNDFYGDNDYHAVFAYGLHNDGTGRYRNHDALRIFYSGASECVVCGNANGDFDGEGEIACNSCVEHVCCCKCGDSIYYHSDLIEHDGRYYCRYCYDQLDVCDSCGSIVDPDNDEDSLKFCICWDNSHDGSWSTKNVLRHHPEDEDYQYNYSENELIIKSVCPDCAEQIFVNGRDEVYQEHLRHSEWYTYYVAIPLNHLTKDGIKLLGIANDVEYFESIQSNKQMSA